jgi:hypothetical protein
MDMEVLFYLGLTVVEIIPLCDPILLTIGVYLLHRAVRSRSSSIMIIAQVVCAASSEFTQIWIAFLGRSSYDRLFLQFQLVNMLNVVANITFYITLIIVAIGIGKRLHSKSVQTSG